MHSKRLILVLALCLLAWATPGAAQTTTDERLWAGLSIQKKPGPSSRWRLSVEALLRTRDGVETIDVWGVRPIVGYAITPRLTVAGAYAFGPSYPATGGTTIEHRAFGQVVFVTPGAGGTFTLRGRVEARFFEGDSGPGGRVRLQVRYGRPIAGRFGWVIYDELFVHTNNTTRLARGIDQNRVFAGISTTLSGAARLETGYLNAFSPGHRGAADRRYHVLSINASVVF